MQIWRSAEAIIFRVASLKEKQPLLPILPCFNGERKATIVKVSKFNMCALDVAISAYQMVYPLAKLQGIGGGIFFST